MHSYILTFCVLALLLVVLFRGWNQSLLRRYRLFYAYIAFVFLASLATIPAGLVFGLESRAYYYIYYVPTLVMPILQLAILWDLYRRIVGNSKLSWRSGLASAILVAVITAPVAWKIFAMPGADFFARYHALTLLFQVTACFLVWRAAFLRRAVRMGRNVQGILLGLSLLVAFQAMNFSGLLFVKPSYLVWAFFLQFVYFLALIVFAYNLWNYEPTRVRETEGAWSQAEARAQLQSVNAKLQEAVRSLLLLR